MQSLATFSQRPHLGLQPFYFFGHVLESSFLLTVCQFWKINLALRWYSFSQLQARRVGLIFVRTWVRVVGAALYNRRLLIRFVFFWILWISFYLRGINICFGIRMDLMQSHGTAKCLKTFGLRIVVLLLSLLVYGMLVWSFANLQKRWLSCKGRIPKSLINILHVHML